MESVFSRADVSVHGQFCELVGSHSGAVVGVGVLVVEREVASRVEALVGVSAQNDDRGELGEDKDGRAIGDEVAEDFGCEVGVAGVRDGVAVVDTFQGVEEGVPLGL